MDKEEKGGMEGGKKEKKVLGEKNRPSYSVF